jgi:hypothetical protein
MMGDAADNIQVYLELEKKTARNFWQEFGSIQKIF